MLLITVYAAVLYTTLTNAFTLNTDPDYLDPILHQEHVQSPNGHYKYGYESPKIKTHQVHDLDGTSKGFYSYMDNQGKVQHVEYVAGNDGFKVIGASVVPSDTPEVEAARKAHLDAYLEAQRIAYVEPRAMLKTRFSTSETLKDTNIPLSVNIPLSYKPNHIFPHPTMFKDKINLFSGQPLDLSYNKHSNNNYNLFNLIHSNPSTTPTPTTNRISIDDNKVFVLPTPTAHSYSKIWPLPPVKFKDLEVNVNGQDLLNTNSKTLYENRIFIPQLTQVPQNLFSGVQMILQPLNQLNPFLNQVTSPINVPTAPNPDPTEKPQEIFNSPRTILQSLNSYQPFQPFLNHILSTQAPTMVSKVDTFPQHSTSIVTAHQSDLIAYQYEQLKKNKVMGTETETSGESPVNNIFISFMRGESNPVTKLVVTKSHVDAERNISVSAAKKAFEALKKKYNIN